MGLERIRLDNLILTRGEVVYTVRTNRLYVTTAKPYHCTNPTLPYSNKMKNKKGI